MGVPFVDLKAQYHSIKAEIDAALIGTMESHPTQTPQLLGAR